MEPSSAGRFVGHEHPLAFPGHVRQHLDVALPQQIADDRLLVLLGIPDRAQHQADRFLFPLCPQNRGFLVALGIENGGLALTLGHGDRRRLLAFRLGHRGPTLALGGHLQAHGFLDFLGHADVLDLDAGQFDAPLRGRLLHLRLDGVVDLAAGLEQLVQLHLADHRAQRGLGEDLHRLTHVGHLVDGAARVDDLVVQRAVDVHRHVVGGHDRLTGKVHHGLAAIDAGLEAAARVVVLSHADVAGHDDGARALDERNDDVHAAFQDAIERPQPLDDHHLGLAHDDQAPGDDDHADGEEDEADDQPREIADSMSTARLKVEGDTDLFVHALALRRRSHQGAFPQA
ncbi:MAG: hypothetical protein U5R48_08900 [Gammaproteobacteria bacterium]|nr:hypothetical protein [Gammaproteobacteria bacterium]